MEVVAVEMNLKLFSMVAAICSCFISYNYTASSRAGKGARP